MKNLLLILILLMPLSLRAQFNYHHPDTEIIDVTNYRSFTISQPIDYWTHVDSRTQFKVGVAMAGMTGLSLYFSTLADGPYIPMAVIFGGISTGKFIHAGILRRQENKYKEWKRYH